MEEVILAGALIFGLATCIFALDALFGSAQALLGYLLDDARRRRGRRARMRRRAVCARIKEGNRLAREYNAYHHR